MGYVPLFDSLVTGTLYGRWPDIGLWPIVLSMADRHGNLDVTPEYIAGVTGLNVSEVVPCMARFCEPDPKSRTTENDGRRLELLDSARAWGWHVVNHAKYREKARKLAYDSERTASGADAARKATERRINGVPSRPARSREIPLSDSDANSDKNQEGGRESFAPPPGLDLGSFSKWSEYRTQIGKPLAPASLFAAQRKLAAFGEEQAAVVEQSIANGWHGLFHLKADRSGAKSTWTPPKSIAELEAEEAARGHS